MVYGSGNLCTQCRTGFYFNGINACVPAPDNCNQVAQNGACTKCIEGYILQNGICYKFDPNCIAYNATTFVCRACNEGFYLNYQFSCQPIPTNCIAANPFGVCLTCRSNYSLSSGQCFPIIPQC